MCADWKDALSSIVASYDPQQIVVVTTTAVYAARSEVAELGYPVLQLTGGETGKSLAAVQQIWDFLLDHHITRRGLMICIGGGMLTDLGGFAASTYKRGIAFLPVPTTLLAMVDASVGGKTGINFGELKNEVGVFRNASSVILDTVFLQTMDRENILSGAAEMLKHALISSREMLAEVMEAECPSSSLLERNVAVKQRVVLEDPTEQGLRKALNLGHTVGHAFESLALRRGTPVLHGYAVAWGLVCELYLSVVKTGFPVDVMRQVVGYIIEHYGRMDITCNDYPQLLELMTHDKKNTAGRINFSLLSDVGQLCLNQTATQQEIEEALDFYREGQ